MSKLRSQRRTNSQSSSPASTTPDTTAGAAPSVPPQSESSSKSESKSNWSASITAISLAPMLYFSGVFYRAGWYKAIGVHESLIPADADQLVFHGAFSYVSAYVRVVELFDPDMLTAWALAWLMFGASLGLLVFSAYRIPRLIAWLRSKRTAIKRVRFNPSSGFGHWARANAIAAIIGSGPFLSILLPFFLVVGLMALLPYRMGRNDAVQHLEKLAEQASSMQSSKHQEMIPGQYPTFALDSVAGKRVYLLMECGDDWCLGFREGRVDAFAREQIADIYGGRPAAREKVREQIKG